MTERKNMKEIGNLGCINIREAPRKNKPNQYLASKSCVLNQFIKEQNSRDHKIKMENELGTRYKLHVESTSIIQTLDQIGRGL